MSAAQQGVPLRAFVIDVHREYVLEEVLKQVMKKVTGMNRNKVKSVICLVDASCIIVLLLSLSVAFVFSDLFLW
jgi:hypothetical protein